jgi:head-tail adaptor
MAPRRSYRHRVKVMEPVVVQDQTTGDMVTYWQPLALDSSVTLDAVPADVLTGPGREFREAGALRSEVSLRVSFRWFSGLLSTHRIEWEGLGYEISSIERDATGRLEYRIACRGVGQALAEVPTAALYPLADDGTVAASFGRGPAAATPPGYQSITYTYAGAGDGQPCAGHPRLGEPVDIPGGSGRREQSRRGAAIRHPSEWRLRRGRPVGNSLGGRVSGSFRDQYFRAFA